MEEMDNTGAAATAIHPLGLGFDRTLGDMRFMGWISLIYGILICLSIVVCNSISCFSSLAVDFSRSAIFSS